MSFEKAHRPTLKTFEEFCEFYEKDTPENKRWLFKQYEFAVKERDRLRQKDKNYRQRKRAEKAALPPTPKKKPGPKGPWKHKPITENLPVSGAGE